MIARTFLLLLIATLWGGFAWAEGDGVPPSPHWTAQQKSALAAIKIRLAPPVLTFGPSAVLGDTEPTFIQYGTNQFYVFSANQDPWETTGTSPTAGYSGTGSGSNAQTVGHNYNVGPPPGTVTYSSSWSGLDTSQYPSGTTTPGLLAARSPGTATDQCGSWPTSAYKIGTLWYLFVHNEGPCDYVDPLGSGQIGYTNESSSMWTSTTGAPGTWTPLTGAGSPGTIISSLAPIVPGWLTGVGDATMIPGDDGFMYAYATFYGPLSINDYQNAVARAPMTNLAPGNWTFLHGGCFCAAALNNPWDTTSNLPAADFIPYVGSSAATMLGTPYKVLIPDGKNHAYWRHTPGGSNIGGIALSISLDRKTFFTYPSPLVNYDFQNFNGRPSPDDLYLYTIMRNDVDGSSTLNEGHWALWGIYVPPNNSLNSRYGIEWPATMTIMTMPQRLSGVPQMGVALENWHNTSTGNPYSGYFRTTTVNPFAGISSDGATEAGWVQYNSLGYVMTNCPNSASNVISCDSIGAQTANRIEECWYSSTDDYQLGIDTNGTSGSCPSGWAHVRTVGWMFKAPQSFGTNPVYSCYASGTPAYHFSSVDPACNGQTVLSFLGYTMAN